jgi:stalled ribosome alternative rescue factor ArfA
MASLSQYSNTPALQQNALDGAPHCFMLRRFRLAESRRGKGSCERFAQTGERASFGLETAANK